MKEWSAGDGILRTATYSCCRSNENSVFSGHQTMLLLTLIFGIVLLPKVYTLNCYECVSGTSGYCTDTVKQCPSQSNVCAATRVASYAGGSKVADISGKGCALLEECITASVNFGAAKNLITSNCCSIDLCNTQPAPDPPTFNPSGKKCFTCNGQTCSETLSCEGNEDHCISATVAVGSEKMTVKGCASKEVCANSQSTQITAAIGTGFSCCQGNYCNSASSRSAGLLLLVTPLIYFVVFS